MPDAEELLAAVFKAHGGLNRWLEIKSLRCRISTGGLTRPMRWQAPGLKKALLEVNTIEPGLSIKPYKGGIGEFSLESVVLLNDDQAIKEVRGAPRRLFKESRRNIFWDNLDGLYHLGYWLWTSLTAPFLLARPGVLIREIEPPGPADHDLRCLQVVFPEDLDTHCRIQLFYFNSDYLLVRQDYTAEVLGPWARETCRFSKHQQFNGLIFPTVSRSTPRLNHGKTLRFPCLSRYRIHEVELVER